jgi:predicted nucleotide-binding protein
MKLAKLVIPHDDACRYIQKQIVKGEQLLGHQIKTKADLILLRENYESWDGFNNTLLLKIFDTDAISNEYSIIYGVAVSLWETLADEIDSVHKDIKSAVSRLKSIISRIELYDVVADQQQHHGLKIKGLANNNRVFIVHGRDERLKESCARLIERLGLEAIILHEQANQGRTIIEKFEEYSEVAFAVILLTPDDEGRLRNIEDKTLYPRARQNVILELGYFIGILGRERVCAMYTEGIELPSDLSGVVYTLVDGSEMWKHKLAKEMEAAGLNVDMNKIK